MRSGQLWRRTAAAGVLLVATAGCGVGTAGQGAEPRRPAQESVSGSTAAPMPETVTRNAAATADERKRVEQFWKQGGIADIAEYDGTTSFKPAAWSKGGAMARSVGRLYAKSADGNLGACTATVVGRNTVVTAGHCVRTSTEGEPAQKATWDQNLYFVPGYRDGKAPLGGFVVRRVHMAKEWQEDGSDIAMLEMNPASDGRSVSEVAGAQRVTFKPEQGVRIDEFGYPYTSRLLQCAGTGVQDPEVPAMLAIPCHMGVGSSGGPYVTDLDPSTGGGTVVAVNVSGNDTTSYGTPLGELARLLHTRSETHASAAG
ncbi:trypsin-like serine protease [Streptomyces sp. NPDC050738]|uniref:trypsin-like serine peptidase n=1 Tax=Streptomyces sp. NPDC050738 TaxID=3154744 RepID=UPI003423E369